MGWTRYVALTAIVIGCSGGSDATQAPGSFSFGGYGGQAAGGGPQNFPPPPSTCNNNVLDPGEQCDGPIPQSCADLTMGSRPIGAPRCTNCYVDMNGCMAAGPQGNGGAPPLGNGGMGGVLGQSGSPPIGSGATPGAGGSTPGAGGVPPGSSNPTIPPVSGACPNFANGTVAVLGDQVQFSVGAKPAGPTAPLVFYWHGTASTAAEFGALAAAVNQGVVAEGGVLASFASTLGGDLRSGTSIFGQADYTVVDQIAACAVQDHNVDPRRIYTMGCSAGGLFSVALAMDRSSYIAAAAPNSGGLVQGAFQNSYTPALMTVHGKMGSDVVIIDFASASASADTSFKNHGGFVIDCDTGGGHCGGGGLAGDAWKFFGAHPYGVSPEPWSSLPAGFSSFCSIK